MTTNDDAFATADNMALLLQPWQRLAAALSPLIGDSGFCALYSRSAKLTSRHFGWLAPATPGKSVERLLAGLRTMFAAVDHAEATRANDAILHTFTKLLAGLIGEALTKQLLSSAPADESAMPVQEQQS